MICEFCAEAADYGYEPRHDECKGCDCHHKPIEGEPRLVGQPDVWLQLGLSPSPVARRCNYCGEWVRVRKDGLLRKHGMRKATPRYPRRWCSGSES